eukprot:m.27719 g.27719  ORF g.27719 m.27719 type:complete len:54 (+) comp11700_c0_seq2:936-1097(+)
MPEWQVDGVLELYKSFDIEADTTNDETDHLETLLGRRPVTIEEWAHHAGSAFV